MNKTVVFMQVAHAISKLGTCDRKQVGAVIIRDGRCVGWGYNGAPPGMPHCDENHHGWSDLLGDSAYEGRYVIWPDGRKEEMTCRNATHAEANALAFAARQGISTDGCTLYVTVSPCEACARLLIAAGIKEVAYDEEYRERGGIDLLYKAGLTITQP